MKTVFSDLVARFSKLFVEDRTPVAGDDLHSFAAKMILNLVQQIEQGEGNVVGFLCLAASKQTDNLCDRPWIIRAIGTPVLNRDPLFQMEIV